MAKCGIAGEESSRKSSCCLLEPRAHTTHLSSQTLWTFHQFGNRPKICKSPSLSQLPYFIQLYSTKTRSKEILRNEGNIFFANNRFIQSFGRQAKKIEDECVMSGSLHELLRERAAPLQEENLAQPVSTHTSTCFSFIWFLRSLHCKKLLLPLVALAIENCFLIAAYLAPKLNLIFIISSQMNWSWPRSLTQKTKPFVPEAPRCNKSDSLCWLHARRPPH